MLTSRMITPGFKLFTGVMLFALAGAFVTGAITFDDLNGDQGIVDAVLGPISVGWKGGVGNHLAYTVFLSIAAAAGFTAGLLAAFRDADPKSVAEAAGVEAVPIVPAPTHASYWPLVGAFAVGTMAVGLVANTALFIAGVFALVVVMLEWTARAWAERASTDPSKVEEYRGRIAYGLEVPGLAVLTIGAFVISGSRVLLAVSETAAVAVAGGLAALIFVVAAAIAARPTIGKSLVTVVLLFGGIAVLAGGVVAAAIGERGFHDQGVHEEEEDAEHGTEGGGTEGDGTDGGGTEEGDPDDPDAGSGDDTSTGGSNDSGDSGSGSEGGG